MAYLQGKTSFPSFNRTRDYFRSGIGSIPQPTIAGPAATATATAPTPAPALAPSPTPAAPAATTPEAAPTPFVQPEYQPVSLGYQTTGGLEEKLFQPVGQATTLGSEQLQQFADVFREQAGPSRTFEGIGGAQTLGTAVEGGAMDPARALVTAQYTGPQGFDPTAAGGLMDLAGRLRTRQTALGTGGGLTTTIQQSTPGATAGEARFTARDTLDADYRARLAAATAGVDPFAQRLETEITGAGEFAQQRAGEESDIAQQAREYLGERRGGITESIQGTIEQRLGEQQQAKGLYGQALEAQDPLAMADILKQAQAGGFLQEGLDPMGFNTEFQQAIAAAPGQREAILGKAEYSSIKDIPFGEVGVDKKGRQTYLIDGKDFREVLGKKSKEAAAFKKRQGDLEDLFSAAPGQNFPGGRVSGALGDDPSLSAMADPLYFGDGAEAPQLAEYLNFDPGMRPSRGNVSTEEQRSQFNRINDLLGDLDRISKDESPFRAAIIGANIEQYLQDEEEALTSAKEELPQAAKEWLNQVKKMRKRYRKEKRGKEYAKIGAAFGATPWGTSLVKSLA